MRRPSVVFDCKSIEPPWRFYDSFVATVFFFFLFFKRDVNWSRGMLGTALKFLNNN